MGFEPNRSTRKDQKAKVPSGWILGVGYKTGGLPLGWLRETTRKASSSFSPLAKLKR